jgi:hypothetical protein
MNQANVHDSRFEDLVQGDKIQAAPLTSLEMAIDRIVKTHGHDAQLVEIFDELAEYLTANPDREIIGLEKKLDNGGRQDLKAKAVRLKNRFDRKITKKQLSPVVQKVHLQILSSIITAFDARVRPLISDGRPLAEVDMVIHDHVILPAYRGIIRFNDMATTEDVCGMLYFLTGKCHIVWSRDC